MVNDVKGQNVYKEHLPLLGELGPGRTGPHGLQVGDHVRFLFNFNEALLCHFTYNECMH